MPETILPFDQALATVLTHAQSLPRKLETETLSLPRSSNRILATPIQADRDQPPFDRSTRDGYAIRAADLTGNPLHLSGTLRAGESWQGPPLQPGQAIEIMTGAPVPPGADAVLMVEHASLSDTVLTPEPRGPRRALLLGGVETRPLQPGENIIPRAAEARAGATVLPAGTLLDAAAIAIAASCGCATVEVLPKPTVAIIATGDELVELTELNTPPEPHQIRNSNSYALQALANHEGGHATRLPIARDNLPDLHDRIAQAAHSDLLLLSGGVSMGKYDLVEQVLRDLGAEFFFTGALIQPGKPIVFGRLPRPASQQVSESAREQVSNSASQQVSEFASQESSAGTTAATAPTAEPAATDWTYFFGLPGNPISTQVCFHLFVAPFLRALAGRADITPRFTQATLAADVKGAPRVTRFLPAELTSDWQQVTVRVLGWQGSGDLAANARANAYAVLPANTEPFPAGTTIRVLLR